MQLTSEQVTSVLLMMKLFGAAVTVLLSVVTWYIIRYLKRKAAREILNNRKLDGLVYALKNINGSFKGWSESFNEKYEQYFQTMESEDKVKYYN